MWVYEIEITNILCFMHVIDSILQEHSIWAFATIYEIKLGSTNTSNI